MVDDPADKLQRGITGLLDEVPLELQRVTDNIKFIKEIKDNPVEPGAYSHKAFGYEVVDVSAILKDNIWNRSIFTVDKLCKMFLKADLEQKKKYLKKKRRIEFNYIWLILLLIGIPVILIIVLFLLPIIAGGLGGII